MSKQEPLALRVLFFKRTYFWVAQCLEYDIVAQGKTIKEAQESFERVFVSNICINLENGIVPLSQFKKAPEKFFDIFKQSERLALGNNIFDNFTNLPSHFQAPAYQIPERRVYG